MPRAIVTGARGFIGRHLSKLLAREGWEVYGLGHGAWPEAEAGRWGLQRWLPGDIDAHNLRLLQLEAGHADAVFHLAGGASVGAAIGNPREDFYRTVATTVELLEWVRLHSPSSRVVAVSSAAVYGAGHEGSIVEGAMSVPFSPYGFHKGMMESLCASYSASYGLASVIARLFSVYGPGLKKQLLWDLCNKLGHGESEIILGGSGDELRDWTDVGDVSRAIYALLEQATVRSPCFNVGTGFGSSVAEVARHAATAWSERTGTRMTPIRFSGVSRPGDPFSLVASPVRLEAVGFKWSIDWRDGIAAYIDWYLAERDRQR